MERLTRAEEQVMQALWKVGKGFVKDVIGAMPRPKRGTDPPAYTTVSTILRILEQKGFVGHEAFGRAHRYHAVVPREQYRARSVRSLVKDYFGGSAQGLLSHFIEREELSMEELDELLRMIEQRKQA
ncbi:MAG: BlaI/MecI/CopY family transcriptional regulator [Flavobacteriales bacterium]